MNPLTFEIIEPVKLPLVKRFYKQHYPAGKAKSDEVILAAYQQQMVAVVRLRPIETFRLLTGMAVDSSLRGQGTGAALMQHCRDKLLKNGDYCFALSHLEEFYCRYGFRPVNESELPASLRNLYQRYSNSGKSLKPLQYIDNS